MADDSIAFTAAQSQHAQDIRAQRDAQRFNANATPDEKIAFVAKKVAVDEAQKAVSRLQIQGCTGAGYNMAVKQPPVAQIPGGGAGRVDPLAFNMDDLPAYDDDTGVTLREGTSITTTIDGVDEEFSFYRIAWCKEGVSGTRYALLSVFVPD